MIPVAEPVLDGNERMYVENAVRSGWVSGGGPYVERFEEQVAKACNKMWCVATLTGTAALHLALVATGARSVCKMPSLWFIAAANAVTQAGAKPYFTDIPQNWTPDFAQISRGVVDAAASIGGQPVMAHPKALQCLSFNGNKTITTGQGGAVVGDDYDMGKRVRHLATLAKERNYTFDDIGFNYRMSNLTAAMGVAQMERLEELSSRKLAIINRYREADLDMVRSSWMAILKTPQKAAVIHGLWAQDIIAKPFWEPLHLQKPYEMHLRDAELINTNEEWDNLVCLPCSANLTVDDQDRVIRCLG